MKACPPGYFRPLCGRAPVHSFSRTQSNRLLMDMLSENDVWVNADVAARRGLKSGDYVRLKNQDGVVSNRIRIKATQRIRPDMVHGFGHTAKGLRFAQQRRQRCTASHPLSDRSSHGRHRDELQLRHLRA
jgi:thiosulfate reductase / polysulfide reductase chain A